MVPKYNIKVATLYVLFIHKFYDIRNIQLDVDSTRKYPQSFQCERLVVVKEEQKIEWKIGLPFNIPGWPFCENV